MQSQSLFATFNKDKKRILNTKLSQVQERYLKRLEIVIYFILVFNPTKTLDR